MDQVKLEQLYRELNQLLYEMEGHYWSRRMTRADADFVAHIRKRVQTAANQVYALQQQMRSWDETAQDLFEERGELWEKLADR